MYYSQYNPALEVMKVIPAPKLAKSKDAYSNQIDFGDHSSKSFERNSNNNNNNNNNKKHYQHESTFDKSSDRNSFPTPMNPVIRNKGRIEKEEIDSPRPPPSSSSSGGSSRLPTSTGSGYEHIKKPKSVIPEKYLKDLPPYKINDEKPKYHKHGKDYDQNGNDVDDEREIEGKPLFSKARSTSSKSSLSASKDEFDFGPVFRKEDKSSKFESENDNDDDDGKISGVHTTRTTSGNLDDLEKSGYDKQLVKTLKNLMATTGKRHKMAFEEDDEHESKSKGKLSNNKNTGIEKGSTIRGKIPEKYMKGSSLPMPDDLSAESEIIDEQLSNLAERIDEKFNEDSSNFERGFRMANYDPNYQYLHQLEMIILVRVGELDGDGSESVTTSEKIGTDGKKLYQHCKTFLEFEECKY
ncbi:hypothetical protein BLOT_001986 [Blomia tropicalis]|nr:hypothetical protein BLOT_001986 [Blomia tropicalis]